MNAEKNHIDDYFRERLFEYEITAPADVWNKIDDKFRQKRLRIIWRISISFAASIAIILSLFTGYYFGMKHTITSNEKIVNTNIKVQSDKIINNYKTGKEANSIVRKNNLSVHNEILTINSTEINYPKTVAIASKTEIANYNTDSSLTKENTVQEYHLAYVEPRKPSLNNFIKSQKLSLSEENIEFALGIEESTEKTEPNSESNKRSLIINGNASPLYSYRNIQSSNSNAASNYFNSTEKPILSYSGGLNLAIELHRWRFESGIYYSKSGQNIDGVYAFVSTNNNNNLKPADNLYANIGTPIIQASNSIQNIQEINSNGYLIKSGSNLSTTISNGQNKNLGYLNEINNSTYQQATVEQRYKYIEIPIIAYYKLIDRKVDFSVTGGFSTNILVGNDALVKNSNNSLSLGPTKGVENFNYAGIIGLAFEMPVAGRLSVHMEPRIKYFLNSINSSDQISTHPYSIGVFSGVSYRF